MKLPIYLDFRNNRLVAGSARGDVTLLPPLIYQKKPAFEIHLLQPRATEFMTLGPYETVDVTGITVDMVLGYRNQAAVAGQAVWTRDEVNDLFTGSLNLNTSALNTLLGANNEKSDLILQITVTEGTDDYTVQIPVTVRRPVHPDGELDPEEYEPPSALILNLADILVDSATIDVERQGNEFFFHVKRKPGGGVGADSEGIYVEPPDDTDISIPLTLIEELVISNPTVESHAFAAALTPGLKYRVQYVDGAVKLAAGQNWRMGGYTMHGADLEPVIGSDTQYATEAECALANACTFVNFTATLATLTLKLLDIPGAFGDNTAGNPPPRFRLYAYGAVGDQCCVGCPEGSEESRTASAAGTTILTPLRNIHSARLTVSDVYGGGEFTHKVVWPITGAQRGHRGSLRIDLPDSADPIIDIRNATAGGTQLLAVKSIRAASQVIADFVFNGTAWMLERWDWKTATGERILNTFTRRNLGNLTGAVEIDLDDAAIQEGALTGNITLTTKAASRATTGFAKAVALVLTATGGARTISIPGMKSIGGLPTTLSADEVAVVSLTSIGSTEIKTLAVFAKQ